MRAKEIIPAKNLIQNMSVATFRISSGVEQMIENLSTTLLFENKSFIASTISKTINDLRLLNDDVNAFDKEIVAAFQKFIDACDKFLELESERPQNAKRLEEAEVVIISIYNFDSIKTRGMEFNSRLKILGSRMNTILEKYTDILKSIINK